MLIKQEFHKLFICGAVRWKYQLYMTLGETEDPPPQEYFLSVGGGDKGAGKICRLSQGHLQINTQKQTHQKRCAAGS